MVINKDSSSVYLEIGPMVTTQTAIFKNYSKDILLKSFKQGGFLFNQFLLYATDVLIFCINTLYALTQSKLPTLLVKMT